MALAGNMKLKHFLALVGGVVLLGGAALVVGTWTLCSALPDPVEVVEPPPPTPPMLDRLENFVALRLLPRPGTELAEDTAHIDLFYDAGPFAPLGIRVLDRNGDRDTVMLRQPKVNGEFGDEQKAMLLLDPPDPAEFEYDVRPLRRANVTKEPSGAE